MTGSMTCGSSRSGHSTHAEPTQSALAGRAAPPEDCGGPWAFLALRQRYHPAAIAGQLAVIFGAVLDAADPDAVVDDHREELAELVRWAALDRFDRRHVNRRLAWYTAGDDRWWSEPCAPTGRSPS